jgi:hypothetical protein
MHLSKTLSTLTPALTPDMSIVAQEFQIIRYSHSKGNTMCMYVFTIFRFLNIFGRHACI